MKRLLFIVASFILIAIFFVSKFAPQTFAQYYNPNAYMTPQTNPDVPQNFRTYSHNAFLSVLSEVTCTLGGQDPFTLDHRCLGWDNKTGMIGYAQQNGGALGLMANLITATFNIPIHSASYVHYLASNFHGVSGTSYAANANEVGAGAKGLDPLLSLWIGFRNTAYLLVVIIFIVLGFLIMLRIKIDPRTVMSIQNQIPKIIFGLLMITFSFVIAGFLIDLMYVTTYFLLNIVKAAVPALNFDPSSITSYDTPFSAVDHIFPDAGQGGIWNAVSGADAALGPTINHVISNIPIVGVVNDFFTAIFALVGAIAGIIGSRSFTNFYDFNAQGGIAGIVLAIVLLIAALTALFRFWIALIQTYITILFNVILGPIRILFGMVPSGPGGGISGWMKDLIANLAVFPISIGFIAMAAAIAKSVGNGAAFTPFLVPGTGLAGVLSFAAILMLPKLPETVKEWFKVKGGGLGDSVGAGLAAGVGFVAGAGRKAGQSIRNTAFRTPDEYRHIQAGVGYKVFNPLASAKGGKTWTKPFRYISGLGGRAIVRAQGMSVPGFNKAREMAAKGTAQPYAPGTPK